MKNYKDYIRGAILHSFRNTKQFLEIELSSDLYEEIIFFIDCDISCSDEKINKIVNNLRDIDEDVSDICFFIPANNQKVKDFKVTRKVVEVSFVNGYTLYFDLKNEFGEPLSISFRKQKNEEFYESVNC